MNENRLKMIEPHPDLTIEWQPSHCDEPGPFHAWPDISLRRSHSRYSEDWQEKVVHLMHRHAPQFEEFEERVKQEIRFKSLELSLALVRQKIVSLESSQSSIIPIDTFVPEPYELLKLFHICVRPVGDEFEASWFDANIHSVGQNEQEAVENLKSLILDYFDSLSQESPETLGPTPTRQLAIIKTFIRKIA